MMFSDNRKQGENSINRTTEIVVLQETNKRLSQKIIELIKKHDQEKQFLMTQIMANSMTKEDDVDQLRQVITMELEAKFNEEMELMRDQIIRKDEAIKLLKEKITAMKYGKRQFEFKSISPAVYEGLTFEEMKNKLVFVIAKNQELEKEIRFKNKFEQNRTKAFVELEITKD